MKNFTHINSTQKTTSYQLVLPLNIEVLIPENASVGLLNEIMDELDYSSLLQAYSRKGIKYQSDFRLPENMGYDADKDEYTCQNGKILRPVGITKCKSKSGYISEITIYECEDCSQCPHKSRCTKAAGNRRLNISKEFQRLRSQSYQNITSPQGILLRMNRSIQVEGAFVINDAAKCCMKKKLLSSTKGTAIPEGTPSFAVPFFHVTKVTV